MKLPDPGRKYHIAMDPATPPPQRGMRWRSRILVASCVIASAMILGAILGLGALRAFEASIVCGIVALWVTEPQVTK